MLFNQLISNKNLKIKSYSIGSNQNIMSISKDLCINPNNLNIITDLEIKKIHPSEGNFIIINTEDNFDTKEKINYLITDLTDKNYIFNLIQELILDELKFFEKIYSCIYLDKGIENLLYHIYDEFLDKVCILDNNKKLLFNPFDFNKVSELYPLKFISSNSSRLFSYLAFENGRPNESEKIQRLCNIISNYIYKEVKKLQTSYDKFYKSMKSLFMGEFNDEDFKILQGLGWNINDNYKVLIIKLESGLFKYRDMFIHGNRFVLDNPQYLFSILDSTHLILLLNKTKLNKNKIEDEIMKYIEKYNLKYYSHNLQNSLLDSNKVYELARYIFDNDIEISKHVQKSLPRLIKPIVRDMNFLNILIPDELKPLLKHDLEKNSEFLQTLYLYLIEERSLIKVSEIMDIHRNSVVYRINRISEIVDIDFEDSNLRYNLIIGLEIIKELYPKIISL